MPQLSQKIKKFTSDYSAFAQNRFCIFLLNGNFKRIVIGAPAEATNKTHLMMHLFIFFLKFSLSRQKFLKKTYNQL